MRTERYNCLILAHTGNPGSRLLVQHIFKKIRRTFSQPIMRSTEHDNSDCELCDAQLVIRQKTFDLALIKDTEEYQMFHQAYFQCGIASPRSLLQLCNVCRHLRVRHLLLCRHRDAEFYKDNTSLSIALNPFCKASMFCVLCRFIAVLDGSRFDDIPQREIQNKYPRRMADACAITH